MIESSAYPWLEEIGKTKYARDLLLKQATAKFGPPTEEQAAKLAAIFDRPRLERLAVRLIKVDSWDALLRGR